jgi:omega-amidase
MLCTEARRHGIWLVGGSVPERVIDAKSGKESLYNTCLVINPNGDVVGKHRKVHLFDIDVPGKMTFKESDSLTAGETVTIVDTPWGKTFSSFAVDFCTAYRAFVSFRRFNCFYHVVQYAITTCKVSS